MWYWQKITYQMLNEEGWIKSKISILVQIKIKLKNVCVCKQSEMRVMRLHVYVRTETFKKECQKYDSPEKL